MDLALRRCLRCDAGFTGYGVQKILSAIPVCDVGTVACEGAGRSPSGQAKCLARKRTGSTGLARSADVVYARDVLDRPSNTPLIIGIAGGTGSGKTTVAGKLAAGMPAGRCVIIEHDAYYRDLGHLHPNERELVNYDHPDALESELLVEHLRRLRAGEAVAVPAYDFVTHTRKPAAQPVEPAPVVIVEGILVFVDERLRAEFDIKIFVDTDADIRLIRRIRRDIEQRGRSFGSVRDQYYRTVRPMHLAYVEPSKRWADLILPEGGDNRVALDVLLGKLGRAAFGTP